MPDRDAFGGGLPTRFRITATSPTEALDAVAHYLDEIRAIDLADRELELADADLDTDERARVLDVHGGLWEDRRREFLARVRIRFIPG